MLLEYDRYPTQVHVKTKLFKNFIGTYFMPKQFLTYKQRVRVKWFENVSITTALSTICYNFSTYSYVLKLI